MTHDVQQVSFIVRNSRGHALFKFLHRQNLYPNINHIGHKECHVFDKEIMGHERVLAELYFHRYPIFNKVSLIVCMNE